MSAIAAALRVGRRPVRSATGRLAGSLPLAFALLFAIGVIVLIRATGLFAGWQPISGALVGRMLLGADGKMTIGEVIAAYPPTALGPMIALRVPAEMIGVTSGELFAALVGALLAGLWLSSLLKAGYRQGPALGLVLLLVCNPLFLGAITAGPEAILTVLGAWFFAMSAFSLRNRSSVNDMIAAAGSLALLVFCGPLGAAFAFASLPFLMLLKPSDIHSREGGSIYLLLLFPTLLGLAGFVLVNWMMLNDALGFLETDIDLGVQWVGQSWFEPLVPVLFSLACAPILVVLFVSAGARRPIQAVVSALLGTLLLSVWLALQSGACRSPIEALCPAVALAAAATMRWPPERGRGLRVALLLALGATGGLSGLLSQGRFSLGEGGAVSDSEFSGIRRMAAEQAVGAFLTGRSDVLIDAAAHPSVVAARGSARGLVTGNDTGFALALLRRRIETRAVAVTAPDYARTQDAVSRNLPDLYASGAPGLTLIYDRAGWRVWSREIPEGDVP